MFEDEDGIDGIEALILLWRRVSAQSRIAAEALRPDMGLRRELGILPVDALEIFDDIFERYGIAAPPAQVRRAETLGDLESILLSWLVKELFPTLAVPHATASRSNLGELVHPFLIGIGCCIGAVLGGSKILLAIGIVPLAIAMISLWLHRDRAPGGSPGDSPPPPPLPPPAPPSAPDAPVLAPLQPSPRLSDAAANRFPEDLCGTGSLSRSRWPRKHVRH